jgi:hypothetical protein
VTLVQEECVPGPDGVDVVGGSAQREVAKGQTCAWGAITPGVAIVCSLPVLRGLLLGGPDLDLDLCGCCTPA